MAELVSIVYSPEGREAKPAGHYTRVPLDRAVLVAGHGIDGDRKGGRGRRQLNVMVAEVLDQLREEGFTTGPGEMGEQLVVAGVDPAALVRGARLRIGDAVIELDIPRTGCDRFEAIQGHPKGAVKGRLGVMAKVVAGGEVAVGDRVEVIPPEPPESP